MTRSDALFAATELFKALDEARLAFLFHGAEEPRESDYGYKHGWIILGTFSFNRDDCFGYQPTYEGP